MGFANSVSGDLIEICHLKKAMQTFLLTSIFVLGISALLRVFRVRQTSHCRRDIADRGIESEATILDVELLNNELRSSASKIRIRLQVEPEKHRNYVIELDRWTDKSELPGFQIGSRIHVKYDPVRPKRVVICE
jgi:hypothetical protein